MHTALWRLRRHLCCLCQVDERRFAILICPLPHGWRMHAMHVPLNVRSTQIWKAAVAVRRHAAAVLLSAARWLLRK